MQNENYYKSQLENKIDEWLSEELVDDNPFRWVSDNLVSNMTEAAWLIVKQNIDIQNYLEREGELKNQP